MIPRPTTKKKPCCKSVKKSPWTDGALLTEYQKEYPGKWGGAQERAEPMPVAFKLAGAFNGETTYNSGFHPHDPSYNGPVRPPHQNVASDEPLDGRTTYKVEFPAKALPYNRVKAPQAAIPNTGAFEDGTTHRAAFPDHGPMQPRGLQLNARSVSVPRGSGPFDGTSVYKDQYQRHGAAAPARGVAEPSRRSALPGGAFDDGTMYKAQYTPKDTILAERYRPQHSLALPDGWHEGMRPGTEYKSHYNAKGAPRAELAARPPSGAVIPKGGFAGATTYGDTFRPNSTPEFVRAKPTNVSMDDGPRPFYGQTTYGKEFEKKDVPYARVRPVETIHTGNAKLEDDTTHKTNFKDWGTQPLRAAQTNRNTLGRAGGPLEDKTTYRNDYLKNHASRPQPVERPPSGMALLKPRGGFDGSTTYGRDYTEKLVDPLARARPVRDYCESCDGDPDCVDDPILMANLEAKRTY